MSHMEGMNATSSLSSNSFSALGNNGTNLRDKIYVFSPADSSIKLALVTYMATVGIVGFMGSILMVCFLKAKKKTTNFLKTLSSEKNLDVYINSLVISDVLCNLISLPTVCVQFYFDVFKGLWGCRVARYLQIVFPCVTMNNLMVISMEKYFSTRNVPRPFLFSTVKKLVWSAWLAGAVFVLIPSATYKQIRYELNETHYTMDCKYDKDHLPFRIIFLTFILFQYIIPCFILMFVSICLIITVKKKTRISVNIMQDNAIKRMTRAAKRKAEILILALLLAFVTPYLLFFGQVLLTMVTKRDIDYHTDFLIRYTSASFAYSNGAVNVVIYSVQMKDFRAFLKKHFWSRFRVMPTNPEIEMQS